MLVRDRTLAASMLTGVMVGARHQCRRHSVGLCAMLISMPERRPKRRGDAWF